MEQTKPNFLSQAELLRLQHRPVYYLVLKSGPMQDSLLPKMVSRGYATVGVVGVKSRVLTYQIPGVGEFRAYADGTGEIEGVGFLYLFALRKHAEAFLEELEVQNFKCLVAVKSKKPV